MNVVAGCSRRLYPMAPPSDEQHLSCVMDEPDTTAKALVPPLPQPQSCRHKTVAGGRLLGFRAGRFNPQEEKRIAYPNDPYCHNTWLGIAISHLRHGRSCCTGSNPETPHHLLQAHRLLVQVGTGAQGGLEVFHAFLVEGVDLGDVHVQRVDHGGLFLGGGGH